MSNKPKRMKPSIIQLLPIVHKMFGKKNHALSHYGCKRRAVEEFYKQIDGCEADITPYPQRMDTTYSGNRQLATDTIITNNKE